MQIVNSLVSGFLIAGAIERQMKRMLPWLVVNFIIWILQLILVVFVLYIMALRSLAPNEILQIGNRCDQFDRMVVLAILTGLITLSIVWGLKLAFVCKFTQNIRAQRRFGTA